MEEVRYRQAAQADVTRIHELIGELADFEDLREQFTGTPADLASRLFGPHPAAHAMVAETASEGVVAYAIWFTTFSTFRVQPGMWLEDLYVTPTARRRGIGRRLLELLAAQAVARGYGRFEWSVLDWNHNAQSLYRNFGAEILPQWQICRVEGAALERYRG